MPNIEIYTKENCKYCTMAKKFFIDNGWPSFTEFIISPRDISALKQNQIAVTRENLLDKLPTAKSVPQIWINGDHVGGYEELIKYPFLRKENHDAT